MDKIFPADEIVDLRRGIDYIGVASGAVIHDGNGRILLMKRGQKARDEQGAWDICGGAIEFTESIEEAVRREVNEELCTTPLSIEYLTMFDAHRKSADGLPTHWIVIIHAVLVKPEKVSIGEPEKIEELGWFTSQSLPSPLHSQFRKSYDEALRRKIVK